MANMGIMVYDGTFIQTAWLLLKDSGVDLRRVEQKNVGWRVVTEPGIGLRKLPWYRGYGGKGSIAKLWSIPAVTLIVALSIILLLRPAQPGQSNPIAPDFRLPAASGAHGLLSLRSLRGHPVLINFFNTQCPPCIAEMPVLRQTARQYQQDGAIVLGVATGGDTMSSARQFARAQRLTYPVVVDTQQDVAWQYTIVGWPTSVFLDRAGRVRARYVGPLDAGTVRDGFAQAGAITCATCQPLSNPELVDSALGSDAMYPSAHAAPSFALRDQTGAVVSPRTLRGKVVLLTFVSAVCIDQCAMVGKTLGQVRRQLGSDAAHLAIVAISVEPEQDTPEATAHYAATSGWRGTDWHYLTAPRAVLTGIWSAYGVYVGPAPRPGQDPAHTAGLYFIDPKGRLRAYDDAPFLAPRVIKTVRALLPAS